ncbi:MAG: response regulator transcription factor [Flavobacteriales bacterium]|nr:response regulator transcription factor [Flavobacteriales bacterium]
MEDKIRVMVVEDEESLMDLICLNLELEGYEVSRATDGGQAIEKFRSNRFDLAILDVMLPRVDGFTVCKTVRLEGNKTPILFLTAKNTSKDRVEGLKIGGDDYLTKPFDLEELLLRVEKLIQRNPESRKSLGELTEYRFGDRCYVNFQAFKIIDKNGVEHEVGQKEIKLLKLLIHRNGEVVSREEILETVWGYDVFPSTRTIDNYILSFRKFFEQNPRQPQFFHSVRGVGYKFTGMN